MSPIKRVGAYYTTIAEVNATGILHDKTHKIPGVDPIPEPWDEIYFGE